MDEFKWIQISFILVTVLQLTAAVTGLSPLYYYVRVEDEVTLACRNVIEDQSDCDSTAWTWTSRSAKAAVELITLGQIAENTGFKSDRLSVAVNCTLVIKKVTKEDAGYFVCQQYKSDRKAAPDAPVYLSVISMTEQMNRDEVTLICSVSTFDGCRQTVKWLFQNKDVKEHNQGVRTSDSPCTASVTVLTYHEIYKSRYKSLECKVSVGDRGQLFPFKLQPSDENPGEVTTATIKSTTPNEKSKTETDTTETGVNDSSKLNAQWRLIVVSVGLSALILTVVMVNVWTKTQGQQTRMDENMVNGSHEDDDAVNYENIRSPAEE
ncbi:uncharacterized protein [Labrus bergylta]|uniref:uncharacterized protein isoform X1 n=1 Tax=Labrus bergylta TaxID=56723 RepID=UPI00331326C6